MIHFAHVWQSPIAYWLNAKPMYVHIMTGAACYADENIRAWCHFFAHIQPVYNVSIFIHQWTVVYVYTIKYTCTSAWTRRADHTFHMCHQRPPPPFVSPSRSPPLSLSVSASSSSIADWLVYGNGRKKCTLCVQHTHTHTHMAATTTTTNRQSLNKTDRRNYSSSIDRMLSSMRYYMSMVIE